MASTTFSGPVTSTNGFVGDVTGNITGNLTGNAFVSAAAVAAAGSTQTNAAAVTVGFTNVTGADGTKGVRLPAAIAGSVAYIRNAAAQPLKVYPATGDKINGGTADAAVIMENSTTMIIIALDTTDWYTLVFTADS